MSATPVRSSIRTPQAVSLQKWGHMKDKCVVALRAGWSTGAIARAYEVPPHMVKHFREEEGIPAAKAGGRGRPTPNVGDVLV